MSTENTSKKKPKEWGAILFWEVVPSKVVIDWLHDMWWIKDKDK